MLDITEDQGYHDLPILAVWFYEHPQMHGPLIEYHTLPAVLVLHCLEY